MHIMEGFLPAKHAVGWGLASAPFVGYGLYAIKKRIREKPEQKMLLGVAAAFTFVLPALKMPSVTGSCSHPTGTGLGAVLFGQPPSGEVETCLFALPSALGAAFIGYYFGVLVTRSKMQRELEQQGKC